MQDNNEEVVQFGIQMMKIILIGAVVAIIIGVLTNTLHYLLLFLLCLMPIRQYAGGFHLKSSKGCAVMSTIILLFVAVVIRYLILPVIVQINMLIVAGLVVIICAPVDNENNPLEAYIKKRYRKTALITLGIECVAFLILYLLKLYKYSQLPVLAIDLIALLLIAGVISNRFSKAQGSRT